MKLIKKLAGQTAIYGLSSVIGRLLNYLLVPLYTLTFTPEEYSIPTELYAYVAFLTIFLTYGIETSFFRHIEKEKNKHVVYSTSLISLLITSSLFLLIMFLFSPNIANFLKYGNNPEYIRFFALIVALDAISSISFAKLRTEDKASRFALIKLAGIFTNIGLNLFFIVYCPYAVENDLHSKAFVNSIYNKNIGVGYIFIANLVSSSIMILMLIPEMTKSIWIFNYDLWKRMMTYGLPLLIGGLAGITNETVDRILLKQVDQPKTIYEDYTKKLHSTISKDKSLISGRDSIILSEIKRAGNKFDKQSKKAKNYIINQSKKAETGIYGALYKLSILMILFIQSYRFAAEPFFFKNEKQKGSRKLYADVMKYFIIATSVIFLIVSLFYKEIVEVFIPSSQYYHESGRETVCVLLLANLFLGIYYNLSIWYKLSEKTYYGAYLMIIGAIITITMNFTLIPKLGFLASAWATLFCYVSMCLASYYLGQKHYRIPYSKDRILFYLTFMLSLFLISFSWELSTLFNISFVALFIFVAYILEKPKKTLISSPELFD